MVPLKEDSSYMAECLELASRAQGNTAPNPMVGSLVVDQDGKIVGSGYHHKAGEPHAEINALRQAGEKAKGATIYVSLEPCSHFGKTPPCVDAIIKAGINKVVAAIGDPNPKVNGTGFDKLSKAGIEVKVGVLEDEAKWLNRAFIKQVEQGIPWLTLKLAATLDGRIADRNGSSKWITGESARAHVQEIRKMHDCILVGASTVRLDNPRLNVRGSNTDHQPYRAVIDPGLTINPDSNFCNANIGGNSLIYCSKDDSSESFRTLNAKNNVEVIPNIPTENNSLELLSILKDMANKGINSVLCEGGSSLASALLKENLVDEIYWFIAPKLLPDSKALSSTGGDKEIKMEDIFQFETIKTVQFDADTLIHLKK